MTPISSSTQSTTCLLLVVIRKRQSLTAAARDGLLTYGNPASILQNDAASIHNSRDYLFAYGIPAMTEAAGAVELSQATMNINLQHDYIDEKLETLWARGV